MVRDLEPLLGKDYGLDYLHNWSGHCDFLSQEDSLLLGGKLDKVPKSQIWKDIIVKDSQWFYVNETQTYKALNYCFKEKNEVKKELII